ncbi:hypothetical protein CERSUDRAFT_112723 [Gelatoporia subvermispora B]|uniref:RRM Nup35-type domain-containing protein n=1 Tax=Ceriporiopsis subvermispora (strain B) TaxID=914234 RepID=M2QPQ3_CERS8|nr:hypothetical protein CERSUDRAFT_112723 [Gelatoporia subvermispora B]
MYPSFSTPSFSTSPQAAQENRPPFPHSHSHPAQHPGSAFSVAGMSNASVAQSPKLRGSTLGNSSLSMSMGDSLSQSRSHYQPGYLMSAAQPSVLPQGSQRHEDTPMVQTKAKLNHVHAGGAAADFGMDSMFENSRQRQRQPLADEDAPPTTSVNDIVNEVYTDSRPRNTAFDPSSSRASLFRSTQPSTPKPAREQTQSSSETLYVIVFGYPPDKYSLTAEYFRSLGETTEPLQNPEISNCFRIGYLHPAEAMRAVRKNGEILGGSWMVGAKWAEPAQAEALLGAAVVRGSLPPEMTSAAGLEPSSPPMNTFAASRMNIDEPLSRSPPLGASTPTVGTPLRLAPSTVAFRRHGTTSSPGSAPKTSVAQLGQSILPSAVTNPSPSKSVLGQVSDLIFGW